MEMKNKEEIFYSLCIGDIQEVAIQEIERELTNEEINQIKDVIATKINWYDAIADTIHQKLKSEELT